MNLTLKEINILLTAISAKYGIGYADDPEVARLQAKLSIWAEVRAGMGDKP